MPPHLNISLDCSRTHGVLHGSIALQSAVGEVNFRVVKSCSRCSIVMTDQTSGERNREVLATLAKYRQAGKDIFFGQNLAHDSTGTLRVDDAVEVIRP